MINFLYPLTHLDVNYSERLNSFQVIGNHSPRLRQDHLATEKLITKGSRSSKLPVLYFLMDTLATGVSVCLLPDLPMEIYLEFRKRDIYNDSNEALPITAAV